MTLEMNKKILQQPRNIQGTKNFFTVDVVDDVEVCTLQLLLEPVEVLTITLKVLHLRKQFFSFSCLPCE